MGWTSSYLCLCKVLSLYICRLTCYACGYAFYGVLLLSGNGRVELLNLGVVPSDTAGELPAMAFYSIFLWFCHQSSNVSVSYVASIRSRSSAYYRFGNTCGNPFKNGYIRVYPFFTAAISGCVSLLYVPDSCFGNHYDYLYGNGRLCAKRY